MATISVLIAAATAVVAVWGLVNATFGSVVMKAEGDGGSGSGGSRDDLGWGNFDDDLPF